jgi:hypothetical protein
MKRARARVGRWTALFVLGVALCGCLTENGDFGRPRPSAWNDSIFPRLGLASATLRGEPTAIHFKYTDDESELRDRAWRFIMPAHERSLFDRQVQEMARTRILPVASQSVDLSAYFFALRSEAFNSPASRYRRLGEDATADRQLLPRFRGNALRIIRADATRLATARASGLVPGSSLSEAEARVAENVGIIVWVCERARYRLAGYRYALDNLVVEMPQDQAIPAERAIAALDGAIHAWCDGLDFGPAEPLRPKPISVRG